MLASNLYLTGTEIDDYPGLHEFLAEKKSAWTSATDITELVADSEIIKRLGNYCATLNEDPHRDVACSYAPHVTAFV